MKKLFLLVLIIGNFFNNIYPKYDTLKLNAPITFTLASLGALFILGGQQEIKKADQIINWDPVEKYEELKNICVNWKEKFGEASYSSKSMYFKWLENKNNKEKLKEMTYYIGKNLRENAEDSVTAGCLLISLTLMINTMLLYTENFY